MPRFCHFIFLVRFIFVSFLLVGIIALMNALASTLQYELGSEPFMHGTKFTYRQLAMLRWIRVFFFVYVLVPIVLTSLLFTFLMWEDLSDIVLLRDLIMLPVLEGIMLWMLQPSEYLKP